jgi:hypothetical protein
MIDIDALLSIDPNLCELDEMLLNLKGHDARTKEEGRKEGLEEGEQKMLLKTVKNALEMNQSDEIICMLFKISKDELKEIKQLLNNC